MAIMQASCRTSFKKTSNFGTFLSTGFNAVYYSIFTTSAHHYGELFLVESDVGKLARFWNIMHQNPYVRYFYKKTLPAVKVKQVIYAPKMLESLKISDLAQKVVKERPGVEKPAKFLLKQREYDPEYCLSFLAHTNYTNHSDKTQ